MPSNPDTPLDDGDWLPCRFFLHALAGVFTLRVLGLAALGVGASMLATSVLLELGANEVRGLLKEFQRPATAAVPLASPVELGARAFGGPVQYWRSITGACWDSLTIPLTPMERMTLFAIALARLSVWALFGGALARIAARHMTLREPPTFTSALRGALKYRLALVAPPLVLLAIAAALLLPLLVHAWLLGVPWLNLLSAVTLPVAILLAVGAAVIAVVLAVAWPLMWASLAAERPDAYDAVGAAYAYVTQRPARLAVYALVALAVATPVGALIELVAAAALYATNAALGPAPVEAAGTHLAAWRLTSFWVEWLAALPMVFYAAYFWFASVAAYLLLRRDVDEKQADELFEPPDARDDGLPTPA